MISAEVPLFVIDARRIVLVFNQGCEKLTGWTAAEVIGQSCSYVNPADDSTIVPVTSALIPPELSFREPVLEVERSVPLKDGSCLLQAVHFFPLREADNPEESRVIGIITDLHQASPSTASCLQTLHAQLLHTIHDLRRGYQLANMIAKTPEMLRVLSQLQLFSQSSATVHFSGEPGVGKEYLARCLHNSRSFTARQPFIPLDCGRLTHFELRRSIQRAFDRDLAPSQFGGTLLLKNVTQLSRDLQELLLSLMKQQPERWKIMSSSQTSFAEAMKDDDCSEEFYFGMTTGVLCVPTLCERQADIPLLAQQILESRNLSQGSRIEGFSDGVWQQFQNYRWPGNVRELVSVVEEACQVCAGSHIDLQDLPFRFRAGQDAQQTGPARQVKSQSLDDYLLDVERTRINEVLEFVRGNKTAAAEILGIPRPKLYRRIEVLGLGDSSGGSEPDEQVAREPGAAPAPERS